MRKHFLLLFLMALLPLSGWAVSFLDETVTASADDAAFNTALGTVGTQQVPGTGIKGGISVLINSTPTWDWDWDGKYYSTQLAAANESTSGLVAPVAEATTPEPGTYYIRIVPTTNANSDYKVIALIIRKASLVAETNQVDGDYLPAQAVANLVYDGTEKELITAATYGNNGSADKCGAITYTIGTLPDGYQTPTDEGCTYSTALPKATNGGTYYVFWQFAGSTRYAGVKGFVQVEIAGKNINNLDATTPAGNNFTMTAAATYTYTGKEQAPTFTVKDGNLDITSSVDVYWFADAYNWPQDLADVDLHDAVTTIGAGTYKALLVGKDNYAGRKTDNSWTFTIKQKDLTLIINNLESTYDGEYVNLDNAGITYYGLCSTDFAASLNNFGKLSVVFADGNQHKDVAYNGNDVTGHALKINLEDGYANTSLFLNYNLKNEDGDDIDITAADQLNPAYINNVAGMYTINRKAVTYKARNIEMEYGSNAPANPGAATLDVADDPTTPQVDETVEGNVEITAGGMVEGESILDAIVFTVAEKAVAGNPGTAWNKAAAGQTYNDKLTIGLTDVQNPTQAQINALNAAKNYIITWQKGAVTVVGKSLTVYVNGSSVEYGTDLTNYDPTYYAGGKELGGTITYTICDVDTEEPIADLENLARGTYLVKMNEGYTDPANYHVVAVEPGYLEIVPKQIQITINPLILNPGTTKAQLNQLASVQDYTSQLVGDDTEVTFTYAFNEAATLDGAQVQTPLIVDQNGNLGANATAGSYSEGIKAGVIAWDDNLTEAENIAAGWIAANDNYVVTFVKAALTVVAGQTLYLAQFDEYLNDKIEAAAEACEANEQLKYAINFSSRTLTEGNWYTMVLPFDIRTADLVAALRAVDDPQAQNPTYHSVYAVVNRFNPASTKKHISFKLEMNLIPANEPFMIKTAETVDLAKANFGTQRIAYTETPATVADADGDQFIGTYAVKSIIMKDGIYYGWYDSDDQKKWRQPVNNAHEMQPMEAYLKYAEGTFENGVAPLITFEDLNQNGTTSIVTFNADSQSFVNVDGWYTLNGVKLQGAPTEKGIYINNGKKIVIK